VLFRYSSEKVIALQQEQITAQEARLAELEAQVGSSIEIIRQQLEISNTMESSISSNALRSFVERAKLDHLIFKFGIYETFMGLAQIDPEFLTDTNIAASAIGTIKARARPASHSCPATARSNRRTRRSTHRVARPWSITGQASGSLAFRPFRGWSSPA
jgi:hypothetical protein